MSTINERVAIIRKLLDLKPGEFSKKLGDHVQRVQDVERGKQRAPSDLLGSIVEIFQVDGTWLLTGRGSAFKDEVETTHIESASGEYSAEEKFKRLQHVRNVIPKFAIMQHRTFNEMQLQAISDICYLCNLNDEQIQLLLTLFDYCE